MQTSEKLTYPCTRCNKMLKTRQSARRHGILVHNWDSETDCVPTDEIVTQFKRRKIALTDPLTDLVHLRYPKKHGGYPESDSGSRRLTAAGCFTTLNSNLAELN